MARRRPQPFSHVLSYKCPLAGDVSQPCRGDAYAVIGSAALKEPVPGNEKALVILRVTKSRRLAEEFIARFHPGDGKTRAPGPRFVALVMRLAHQTVGKNAEPEQLQRAAVSCAARVAELGDTFAVIRAEDAKKKAAKDKAAKEKAAKEKAAKEKAAEADAKKAKDKK